MQHWNESHNARLAKWIAARGRELNFCYVEVPFEQILALEKAYIRKYQPLANEVMYKQFKPSAETLTSC